MRPAVLAVSAMVLLTRAVSAQVAHPPNLRMPPPDGAEVQAQARLTEAERLMGKDEFAAAARELQEALELDPLLFMAHYGLGRARMATKEYAAAAAAFEAARRAFHDRAEENSHRRFRQEAVREERMRRLRAAITAGSPQLRGEASGWQAELAMLEATKALSQGPSTHVPAPLSLALGSAYFRLGRLADAEREYRAALAMQPKFAEAGINLAVVLLMTGRPADAREQLALAKKNGASVPAGLEKDIDAAIAKGSPP